MSAVVWRPVTGIVCGGRSTGVRGTVVRSAVPPARTVPVWWSSRYATWGWPPAFGRLGGPRPPGGLRGRRLRRLCVSSVSVAQRFPCYGLGWSAFGLPLSLLRVVLQRFSCSVVGTRLRRRSISIALSCNGFRVRGSASPPSRACRLRCPASRPPAGAYAVFFSS
jgi:hypothetical protein